MGAQQSTSVAVSNVITKSATNVLMKNANSCSQNNTSIQSMNFDHISAGQNCKLGFTNIKQEAVQIPNFTCSSSQAQSSNLQSMFANALQQAAKAETSGMPIFSSSSSNSAILSNVVNNISTNVNMTNTSECVQNNFAQQKLDFSNIASECPFVCGQQIDFTKISPEQLEVLNKLCTVQFGDISQLMVQKAVASCMADNKAIQEAITKVDNVVKQEATSSSSGLFSGISTNASIGSSASIFVFLSIGLSLSSLLGGSSGNGY